MLLDIRHVSKSYLLGHTEVVALRDLSMSVEKGDFLVVAGPSGSGKSTLLHIMGLLDDPSFGSVSFQLDEQEFESTNPVEIRREHIGFIFQDFSLIPVLTAYENVMYPLLLTGLKKHDRHKQVKAALEKVGLWGRKDHRPDELSGGQRQRVAIARALVKNPSLIIADEPTANLDSKTASGIVNLLVELNQKDNVTVVVSSHDPCVIRKSPKVITLSDGEVVQGKEVIYA